MAQHIEATVEHSGIEKEVDKGALAMMMDNLQISQYQFPIKSTIRELVSNGSDSIIEKKMAIGILKGESKVEDHYYVMGTNSEMDEAIRNNPGVYKDSRFDPLYYDLNYLSHDNTVSIKYYEHGSLVKDQLVIRDNGVGLGDYRLYGYLRLGYSTKRLAKTPLGKFGIGAKSPLSMGVTNFLMTTVHNGRKFQFLIYSTHYESIIMPWNVGDGTDNDFIYFYKEDGTPVLDNSGELQKFYYLDTDEKNYTEITIDCKKHYKTDVINAVQSQLLYFDNVSFSVIDSAGNKTDIPVTAPKLYEDDYLIISDNNQFSKPHIVINKVSYGYINFEELELEQSSGNIGIKVSPDEVNITPNRENLRWDEITRKTVLERFAQANEAILRVIEQNLSQTDFMEWFSAANSIVGYNNHKTITDDRIAKVLSQMRLITKHPDSHPQFKPYPGFYYSHLLSIMFPGIKVRKVSLLRVKKPGGKYRDYVDRERVDMVGTLFEYPVYIVDKGISPKKDMLMLGQLHPNGFLIIQNIRPDNYKPGELADLVDVFTEESTDSAEIKKNGELKEWIKEQYKRAGKYRNDPKLAAKLLLGNYPSYDELEIHEVNAADKQELSPEERRKLEKRIVLKTPRIRDSTWPKAEPRIEDLNKLNKDLYYGLYDEEGRDAALIMLAANITKPYYTHLDVDTSVNNRAKEVGIIDNLWKSVYSLHWLDPQAKVMLAMISQENIKYFAGEFYYITEFYNRFEDGVITMADQLIKWNTARIIKDKLTGLGFMSNMLGFSPIMHSRYTALTMYISEHYRSTAPIELINGIIEHLDKVTQLQLFIRDNKDNTELINSLTKELFDQDQFADLIIGAKAVEIEIVDTAEELVAWAAPVQDMLGMTKLAHDYIALTQEEEEAIRQYIDWRTQ